MVEAAVAIGDTSVRDQRCRRDVRDIGVTLEISV